jgi:hypothetical protein
MAMPAPGLLTIDGRWFRDTDGRARWLRGVNLGGDCKVPAGPDGHSWRPTDFSDHRTVSFVGRPAPLDQIDSHLARIAGWGFNCLRLLTTWEAVAHAGPGACDEAYLDYLRTVCRKAGDHGLHVFIDFHQDVWSRMSGGDGAPGWTFAAVGLDFTRFHAADAAHVMQYRYDPAIGGRQADYPQMSWGSNYRLPANGIMWTLFFAGDTFAPGLRIDGQGAGTWLQAQYRDAVRTVAERVADLDHVIGFDSLNEPGTGWIGQRLDKSPRALSGPALSPLDGLAIASGLARDVPVATPGQGITGRRRMNPDGVSIWLPGHHCPFRAAGAWDIGPDGAAVATDPDHFSMIGSQPVDHETMFMRPFFHDVADTIRAVRPDWLLFAEIDPFTALRGGHGFPEPMPIGTVNASHWYDLGALITKRFDPDHAVDPFSGVELQGSDAIRAHYAGQLERLRAVGDRLVPPAPTLIGEFGIPFDLNDASAYAAWAAGDRSNGPWRPQIIAQALMYDAFDALGLHSTQWNYTVSNRNDAMIGDGWNQEDLSIWSEDQATGADDPDSGSRALTGFCRPHALAVQGTPIHQHWDWQANRYELAFDADPAIAAPTVIFIPRTLATALPAIHFENCTLLASADRLLTIAATTPGQARITIAWR